MTPERKKQKKQKKKKKTKTRTEEDKQQWQWLVKKENAIPARQSPDQKLCACSM